MDLENEWKSAKYDSEAFLLKLKSKEQIGWNKY